MKSIVEYKEGIRGQILWDCVTTGETEEVNDPIDLAEEASEEKKDESGDGEDGEEEEAEFDDEENSMAEIYF